MKVGDLVRPRCGPWGLPLVGHNPGIVIEETEGACKVLFPAVNGEIRAFLKSSLEVICAKQKTA